MTVKEYMVKFLKLYCDNDDHGYTNDYPYNKWWIEPDLDCGSLMSLVLHMALLQIGIDTGYEYFEPMGSSGLYNEGFLLRYCDKYDYDTVYDEPADILVSSGHTEMVYSLDPKRLGGAQNDLDGREGDSSGREVSIHPYFNNGWKWIFRLKDRYNKTIEESGGLDMSMIPVVKIGDENNTVLAYQYLMRYKLGYDRQELSGKFTAKMSYNVRCYQREHKLVEDGIIGEQTGYSMIVQTGYEEP